jgi:hypothetical protein
MIPPGTKEKKRYKIGSYGGGTLWCVSVSPAGLFILFNDTVIARRVARPDTRRLWDWCSLDPAWKVTAIEGSEIWVRHNDNEGVFVSLHGGSK